MEKGKIERQNRRLGHRIKILFGFQFFIFLFASSFGASPSVIDIFSYPDEGAIQAAWPAQEESPPAVLANGPEGRAVGKFALPFSKLKGWRYFWDKELDLDLSGVDRVKIRLRAQDLGAVGSCKIYFESGDGWFTLPDAGLSEGWNEVVFLTEAASKEGNPAGWDNIKRIRLAFLPGSKTDTSVEVASIQAVSGWTADEMGAFGPYADFRDAYGKIGTAGAGRPSENLIRPRLESALKIYQESSVPGEAAIIQAGIKRGRRLLAEAWALVQDPKPGEFRGFWGHYGDGPRGEKGERAMTWAEAVPLLADAGFNAVFPNMLWSGVAYYPSAIVPNHELVAKEGDFLEPLVKAAHARGVEVHLWKVSWQFAEDWLAPKGVSEPFRKQKRLQRKLDGTEAPWLCPSDPRNREYELSAFLEAAGRGVDGVHLDYIRYGGQDVCYCEGCKKRFGKETRRKVKAWPAEVGPAGLRFEEYAAWKRERITSFVRELRKRLKEKYPAVKLSAAVFSRIEQAKQSVSQDWTAWVQEGLLDFVCTMTYTEDPADFRSTVRSQMEAIGGKAPLYTGMFAAYSPEKVQALESAVHQIRIQRELGASGFVLFELQAHLFDSLIPWLSSGITRAAVKSIP